MQGRGSPAPCLYKMIAKDTADLIVVWRRKSQYASLLFTFLCVCSGGLFFVACVLAPKLKTWVMTTSAAPQDADIAIVSVDGSDICTPVAHTEVAGVHYAAVEVQCKRYYTSAAQSWQLCAVPDVPPSFSSYLFHPSSSDALLRTQYGTNTMSLPPVSFWDILAETVFHPFYLFQYFAVTVWMVEYYYEYSIVILLITGGAIYLTTNESVENLQRLHDLAGRSSTVQVLQSETTLEVSDTELLPGQRFLINEGCTVPCDAVVISGRASVDESMLTGESIPVNKTPVEASIFSRNTDDTDSINKHPGNILFCGTHVLTTSASSATKEPCVAVVYRTGFRSAKGQLVAALLDPKDKFLSFFSDTIWVIFFMVLVSTGLYIWSAVYLHKQGLPWAQVSLYYLDTLTFAVPPALTACLTVATGIAITRLNKKDIYVSESGRVNWAGIVSIACFDKTGTLTEEKLNFKGITTTQSASIESSDCDNVNPLHSVSKKCHSQACLEVMATCHALALIDGKPEGDVLEIELLRESGFVLGTAANGNVTAHLPEDPLKRYEILRHFGFTSDKARSGSLVRRPDGSMVYVLKGSPEMLLDMIKNSTVPKNVGEMLTELSKKGLRVVAFAHGEVPAEQAAKANQEDLEKNLNFLGLVYLSNALKKETVSTMQTLRKADIQCNMITGDHIYTAIAIAKECELLSADRPLYLVDAGTDALEISLYESNEDMSIDTAEFLDSVTTNNISGQIAVTGRALNVIKHCYSPQLRTFLQHTQVFARMKPADKKFIVENLQHTIPAQADVEATDGDDEEKRLSVVSQLSQVLEVDADVTHVLFCGDGANDMAALRAATVGVSLCEAETSVAAPVTSRLQTPGAVVDIIQEGRCALITAYVLVSFNIMYAIIGLFSLILTYYYGLRMGNYTYFIQDLVYALILGIAISNTQPYPVLDKQLPPLRLFTKYFTFKLVTQLICFCCFQLIAVRCLSATKWYTRYDLGDAEPVSESYTYESAVIADMGLAQIMIASVTSTIDKPFRRAWYENRTHVIAFCFQTVYLMYQIFGRDPFLRDFLEIKSLPLSFGGWLVLIIVGNWIVSLLLLYVCDLLFMTKKEIVLSKK